MIHESSYSFIQAYQSVKELLFIRETGFTVYISRSVFKNLNLNK